VHTFILFITLNSSVANQCIYYYMKAHELKTQTFCKQGVE